jgi:hypothetical protein
MLKKLTVGFAPALLVVAAMSLPAIAQAAPHWYQNGVPIPQGKPKVVKTTGTLTFTETSSGTVVKCTVADAEVLLNPVGGAAGTDLMKAFKVSNCAPDPCPLSTSGVPRALVVKALNLPWPSELIEVPPIADSFTGVELKFSCKGSSTFKIYSGTLSPWVGLGFLEFDSPTTGTLGTLWVNGIDNFVPATITAKNP